MAETFEHKSVIERSASQRNASAVGKMVGSEIKESDRKFSAWRELIYGRIESDGLTQSGRRTRRARRGKRIFAEVTFVLAIIQVIAELIRIIADSYN